MFLFGSSNDFYSFLAPLPKTNPKLDTEVSWSLGEIYICHVAVECILEDFVRMDQR